MREVFSNSAIKQGSLKTGTSWMNVTATISCLVTLCSCALIYAQYRCDWNSFNAGGAPMSSADFRVNVSVSQTAVGYLTGTNFNSFIGFWQIEPQVGIEEDEPEKMANLTRLETKLSIAKPNPFRNNAIIYYSLKTTTHTRLIVYDRAGRIVSTLIDGIIKPGVYTINWRGDDAYGKKLPSGIYFLKFQAETYQKIKKLLLVR